MTSQNNQVTLGFSNAWAAASVAATLLIVAGLVFQFGELGCRQMSHGNLWLASFLAESICNWLVLHGSAPAFHPLRDFWPLLVSLGLVILLMAGRAKGTRMLDSTDKEDPHGQ